MYKKKESWLSCYTHSAAYATSIKPYTFHTNKEIVLFCAWWRLLLMLLLLFMPQNALREHFFDISDLEIGEEEAEQQQQQYIYLWKITSNRLWSLTAHNCMLYILQGKPGTHIHHKMWLHWLLFEVFFSFFLVTHLNEPLFIRLLASLAEHTLKSFSYICKL